MLFEQILLFYRQQEYEYISYLVDDTSLFTDDDFTVSVEIKTSDGTSLSKTEGVVPKNIYFSDYYSGYLRFYFDIPMPNITKNGEYVLYTLLNFPDGSGVALEGKNIHIGNYEIVYSLYADRVTPSTEEFAVTVEIGTYVIRNNSVYL